MEKQHLLFKSKERRERYMDIVAQKKVKGQEEKEIHHLEESLQDINPERSGRK